MSESPETTALPFSKSEANEKAEQLATSSSYGSYLRPSNDDGVRNNTKRYAADGHMVLIPEPSDNGDDPLNWSQHKKNIVLFVVACVSFMSDYESSTGIAALVPQVHYFDLPAATLTHSFTGHITCLGVAGPFLVAIASYFGRLPTLLYFQLLALACGVWAGAATSYPSYFAARVCQGLTATVGQSTGLMWIKDIFFFHEQARKINWWSLGVIGSPYVGPMVASFIIWRRPWQWCFWMLTILNGVCIILTVAFLDEPFYNRDIAEPRPYKGSRLEWMLGLEQWRNRRTTDGAVQCIMRPIIAVSKIPLLLVLTFYFLNFAWVIGVNATVSLWLTDLYDFGERELGLIYFAPIIGVLLGWLIGHWLHDSIAVYFAKRHHGIVTPETRLWVTYPATIIVVVTTVLFGYALQRLWHYMAVAVLFAAQVTGIMIATVGIEAYLLDAYPEGSGEVCAWVNFARAFSGFMSTYVQLDWVAKSGLKTVFGIQAGISAASLIPVVLLQVYGERIRRWQGPMRLSTKS